MVLALVATPVAWAGYVFFAHYHYGAFVPRDGFVDVDLKELGHFPFDSKVGAESSIPLKARQLDGKRVRLQGLMYSASGARQLDRFQLVYDIQICCFNSPPKVQERVFVFCPAGAGVEYVVQRDVRVTGIMHVKINRDPQTGLTRSIFTLDMERVEPV